MRSVAVDRALALPPDDAVEVLLTLTENQWFERKSGSIKPADFAIPLCALANSEGGILVAGLHGGAVAPVSDRADNDLRQAALDFTHPPVRHTVTELHTDRGRVLVFEVPPSEQVHQTRKGDCYLRVGDESRKLGFAQRQELEWDRGLAHFENTVVVGASTKGLDQSAVKKFQALLGSSSPALALQARDLVKDGGRVNVAGYLLFAKNPQQMFPSAHVRVLKYSDTDRGAGRMQSLEDGADVRCEGTLLEQIERATREVKRLMPRRRVLKDSGRFEGAEIIPRDAWLEGLVNAVTHRSYSISGDHTRVEIFPNRIEITSPGRFPGLADPSRPESIGRSARNPRIARVLSDQGVTQELGEGIRRIFAEMRRLGLEDPIYTQGPESVRLTLLASHAISKDVADGLGAGTMKVLDAMRRAQKPLGTGQIAELAGVARPTVIRHLKALQSQGLITWEGESARDPRATWRVN